jgi:RNA polymerase sigma-70 factor (ECF subfamily)
MQGWRCPPAAISRFHRQADAGRWDVSPDRFAEVLDRSVSKAFDSPPDARELERYLASLHLADLALACACANGHEGAWDHFIREHRPGLYRAADAIDSSGGSRELADSLYAELFGLVERAGRRRSLFEYFHGRSSLSTWLRAVLAQRHVDRLRRARRLEPLPPEDAPSLAHAGEQPEPRAARYVQLMRRAVHRAVAALAPRDRLRLSYYYGQDLTLAQIGRALGEHEATVSRNLGRARREIRTRVERHLREQEHMEAAQIEECFAAVVNDAGPLDVVDLLAAAGARELDPADPAQRRAEPPGPEAPRKDPPGQRSKERAEGASA